MSLVAEEEEGIQEGVVVGAGSGGTSTGITARSERKRQRERKRRSALSNAFDELASFVVRMDPEPGNVDNERLASRKKRAKNSSERESYHGISQLDIVGRTLKLLKRLHSENESHKRMLDTMQSHKVVQYGASEKMNKGTFSSSRPAWNRADESNYPPAAYHHAAAAYHPPSSYSHSLSIYDYHAGAATMTTYDGPDYGPPGQSRSNDHQYWTNDWGRRRPGDHYGDHHHPF